MNLLWQTIKFILKWLLIGYLVTIGGVVLFVFVVAMLVSVKFWRHQLPSMFD